MKILIVKLGAIGDIVHTLPALAAIRSNFSDAEICWVAEERSAEILRDNPLIDDVVEIKRRTGSSGAITGARQHNVIDRILPRIREQIRSLRKSRFDVAVDFQGLLKSGIITKLSGTKRRWSFATRHLREPASRIFFTDTVKLPDEIHVIRQNLLLASGALDISISNGMPCEFPIETSVKHRQEAQSIAEKAVTDFALLNPAGSWVTKLWHAEKYGVLADRLWEEKGLASIVVTAPNEVDLAEKAVEKSRSGKIITATPSLKGFFELSRIARVYVGGDTGPTHLAIAAGTPVVGIFGPTGWWRNGSLNPLDICVERLDIGCRENCHRRTCSKWICMDIGVETVFEAVCERLRGIL